MVEIVDYKQIEKLRMVEINDEVYDGEQFVTDTAGNILILDFEKIDEKFKQRGKCFLVYSLGQSIICYDFKESLDENGMFLLYKDRKYKISEITDNSSSQICEIDIDEPYRSAHCDVILSNKETTKKVLNSIHFSDGKFLYSHKRIFDIIEGSNRIKSQDSSLLLSFFDNLKLTTDLSFKRFMLIPESGKNHFCYMFPGKNNDIVVISFSEDLKNADFISAYIFNSNMRNICSIIEYFKNIPLLTPCNVKICFKDTIISFSTLMNPPSLEYGYNFMIKMLSSVINERQTIFYSTDNTKCFRTILFFYHIIRPFKYKFLIATQISSKIQNILKSPFPFILGTPNRDFKHENPGILFIDLDESEVYNSNRDIIPFESELRKKFRKYAKSNINKAFKIVFREYFEILKNNINIAREDFIKENISNIELLRDMIARPHVIQKKMNTLSTKFTENFVHTRIFKDYMSNTEENIVLNYTVGQARENSSRTIFLKKALIEQNSPFIYAIFIHIICDSEFITLLDANFFQHPISDAILSEIIKRLAQMDKFDRIFQLLQTLSKKRVNLSSNLLLNVCYFNLRQRELSEMIDLRDSVITIYKSCACCGATINDLKIREKLHERKFLINKEEKECKMKHNSLFIKINENEEYVCDIYEPEDLFLYIKRREFFNLKEFEKNIFWNVVTYFLLYNLPFNYVEPLDDVNCDIIIEETPCNPYFNLLKLPDIKYDK